MTDTNEGDFDAGEDLEDLDATWFRDRQGSRSNRIPLAREHAVENQCGRCLNQRLSKLTRYGMSGRWYLCEPCGQGLNVPISGAELAKIWRVDVERVVINGRETSLAAVVKATAAKGKRKTKGREGQAGFVN